MTDDSSPRQCRNCMMRREVFSCSRRGGGSYKRAPRWNSSSICAECAVGLLRNASVDHDPSNWDAQHLAHIVASIDTDEAREVTASWEAKREAKKAASRAHDEQMKPHRERTRERDAIRSFVSAKSRTEGPHRETYRVVSGDLTRTTVASPNIGWTIEKDGTSTWPKTIRDQIADYIDAEAEATEYLDVETLRALAADIRAGKHMSPEDQDS